MYETMTIANQHGVRVPTQEEIEAYRAVHHYLARMGCDEKVAPGVRTLVDQFNDLVDPATKPLSGHGLGCCPTTGVNRAAELYADASAYFKAGTAYYTQETDAPTPAADPVADALAAIQASLTNLENELALLGGRVTVLEAG